MAVERVIGIDFGTSTSMIRVKRYENGKPVGEALETKEVMFGGNGVLVPTLIMKKEDDPSVVYFGYEAQQKKRKFTNYHSFKVNLESDNEEKRAEARKLTEEFLAYMGKEYRAQSDGGHLGNPDDKERTIISYPVKWSEETKQFMVESAKKAGFPNVTGMDEAQAAIQAVTVMSTSYLQKHGMLQNGKATNILLIDMGAGTTDLVLCRYTPGEKSKTEILNTWPKDGNVLFGGKEIDVLLKRFFWDKMDETDAQLVLKRIGIDKFKSWKEESVSPALKNNDSVCDFEALDSCVDMMGVNMDEYCLDRVELEKCLGNYLKQFPVLINECVRNSSIKGFDVDIVIVTGGHSQWYFVQDMLAGKMPQFGNIDLPKIKNDSSRIIPVSRPQETVALGLVYGSVTGSEKDINSDWEFKEPYSEGLAAVCKNNKWGYIDQTGQLVIPCEWGWPGDFKNGLAMTTRNGKSGYIDKNGQIKIPFEWGIAEADDFSEGLACVCKNDKWGYIDTNGRVVIPYEWDDANGFKNGVAPVWKNGEKYIIDHVGRIIYKENDFKQVETSNPVKSEKNVNTNATTKNTGMMNSEYSKKNSTSKTPEKKEETSEYTPESEFELGNIGEDYYIRKYIGNRSVVSVPPVIRGRKVVAIGKNAFANLIQDMFRTKNLREVIVPTTVKRIEVGAFYNCTKLEIVKATKNIEYIGMGAFASCFKLHTLDFGMGETGYKMVKFPRGLKEIGNNAFGDASGFGCVLKEVTLDKKTKVQNILGIKVFPPNQCAVFYYND